MDERKDISVFLSSAPLYSEKEVGGFTDKTHFCIPFKFHCDICQGQEGFELFIPHANTSGQNGFTQYSYNSGNVSSTVTAQIYYGLCQNCKQYKMTMILQIKKDTVYDKGVTPPKLITSITTVQKIGQYPKFNLEPPFYVKKFLMSEELKMYKYAKICHYDGFGIASYAYLRRVLEDVAKRILIAQQTAECNEILKQYAIDFKTTPLMDKMDNFLPLGARRKDIEVNTFSLLYAKLSDGVHSKKEDECNTIPIDGKYKAAKDIFDLFDYLLECFVNDGEHKRIAQSIAKKLNDDNTYKQ